MEFSIVCIFPWADLESLAFCNVVHFAQDDFS